MIIGLGSDICNIKRIEKAWEKFGNRFINRLCGTQEQSELDKIKEDKNRYIASLAKRFAAKEAFVKAIGTGFVKGISWAEIEVVHQENGRPTLVVAGKAAEILHEIAPTTKLWLSLSDDTPFAQAVVIIERC